MKIELNISDELFEHLGLFTTRKERFIAEAIVEKIEKSRRLEALLAEGYQATFEEDLRLAQLFEGTDGESV